MKILLIASLLCINNPVVPPDTAKKDTQKKQAAPQASPQKQALPAAKPAPKKPAKTPMPFYPSPILTDLF